MPVPPLSGLAAATSAGEASLGLATTVSVRAAVVIAISCERSASSAAMVWLPGTISIAWTALKALDPGANSLPPTATPMIATKAKMAAGKTMPNRRNRPRLRLLLRAPVRCRDKAILSSGHAREMLTAVSAESRLSGRGPLRYSRRAADPPHLTWCAVWPPRASTAGGQQCQKDRPCARHFGKKSPGGFTGTAVTMITRCKRLVTNSDQTVMQWMLVM